MKCLKKIIYKCIKSDARIGLLEVGKQALLVLLKVKFSMKCRGWSNVTSSDIKCKATECKYWR